MVNGSDGMCDIAGTTGCVDEGIPGCRELKTCGGIANILTKSIIMEGVGRYGILGCRWQWACCVVYEVMFSFS
jgi:hypothetical protein